jgi:hypothetical protein
VGGVSYCYLPLSWKSWNRFECAVGGVFLTWREIKILVTDVYHTTYKISVLILHRT